MLALHRKNIGYFGFASGKYGAKRIKNKHTVILMNNGVFFTVQ